MIDRNIKSGGAYLKEFIIFNRPFQFLTNDSQWYKLEDYLNRYLFSNKWGNYAILLLIVVFICFLLSISFHGMAKKMINIVTLLSYIGVLILLFIVNRETGRGVRVFSISDYLTDTGFHETRVLITLINCLFFVPFGIFLRKVSGKGYAIVNVFLVVIAATGIEVAQYVFAKGFTALDDMFVYIVGGFAGLLLASPFCLISEYLEERRKEKLRRKNRTMTEYRSSWEPRRRGQYDRIDRGYEETPRYQEPDDEQWYEVENEVKYNEKYDENY